jgi:hypothetical protein
VCETKGKKTMKRAIEARHSELLKGETKTTRKRRIFSQ